MEKEKILIVGGGIAGLSAGIHALNAGFDAVIFEKNANVGGCCSAWERHGYTIDNCIHWMAGTKKGTPYYHIWRTVGALSDDVELISRESFYHSEYNGERATLWRDLNRTERELCTISPQDKKEIHRFIEYTRLCETLFSTENDGMLMNSVRSYASLLPRIGALRTVIKYFKLNLKQLSEKFRHPLLQRLIADFSVKEYEAYWLILSYSLFTSGNGDIPKGGSFALAERMKETFLALGGELHLCSPVKKIIVSSSTVPLNEAIILKKGEWELELPPHAEAVLTERGEEIHGDYVICALHHVYTRLLGENPKLGVFKKTVHKIGRHPTYSSFQVAFAADDTMPDVDDTLTFECKPFRTGATVFRRLCVKNYRAYGEHIAPPGKTVIQCSIPQRQNDLRFWEKMAKDKEEYRKNKAETAEIIRMRIEKRFPQYRGKLTVLDTWTPISYIRRNNNHAGAYMRHITTVISKSAMLPLEVHGVENLYLAGHQMRYPGGIPTAALSGKQAVERIQKTKELLHAFDTDILLGKPKKKK